MSGLLFTLPATVMGPGEMLDDTADTSMSGASILCDSSNISCVFRSLSAAVSGASEIQSLVRSIVKNQMILDCLDLLEMTMIKFGSDKSNKY